MRLKSFSKYFLRGMFTLLPFGLTLLVLFSFLAWTEELSKSVFSVVASEIYFPGLGLIIGICLVCALGFLTTLPFAAKIIDAIELPFKNMPIIKSVYTALKSLSDFFSPDSQHSDQQVVVVKLPGSEIEMMGFVTRRNLNDLPNEFTKIDRVAVFLPMSYMVGGLTIFVPRSHIKKTNIKVEEAMRSALTAWMPSSEEDLADLF
jgi:uncharacterized membrane protein